MEGMVRTSPSPPHLQNYLDYKDFLRDWFDWKKEVSPRFSHRAFARRMGQSSPSIGVDLVAGRRRITPALQEPLCKALKLKAEERRYLPAEHRELTDEMKIEMKASVRTQPPPRPMPHLTS